MDQPFVRGGLLEGRTAGSDRWAEAGREGGAFCSPIHISQA